MLNVVPLDDGFSYSAREMRQISRNLKKQLSSEYFPIEEDVEMSEIVEEDSDSDSDSDYCPYFSTKENTRRVKRSHEIKYKKTSETNDISAFQKMPNVGFNKIEKKDNSRKARKIAAAELVKSKPTNKIVSFKDQIDKLKPFRIPKGKYSKDEEWISSNQVRRSMRLVNVHIDYTEDY
jgi:hypothetical protein